MQEKAEDVAASVESADSVVGNPQESFADSPADDSSVMYVPPVAAGASAAGAATGAAVDEAPAYPRSSGDTTLMLVAFVFNILSCVSLGWFLIPLAWLIPMTVISYGLYKGKKANTVAFGVCTLLFVNLVSGILLLVAQKDEKQI